MVLSRNKFHSRKLQKEMIDKNSEKLDNLESNANPTEIGTLSSNIPETKQSEQKIEIEKEVIDLKGLKKVSSSVDVMINTIEKNSNNITKRSELRKSRNKEHCNCKSGCANNHCSCQQNGKNCSNMCHNATNCSNLE